MSDLYPPDMGPTRSGVHSDHELTQLRRTKFWRRAFVGLGVLAAVGLLVFSAYGVYAIRTAQVGNGETLRIVRDCTQLGGTCYTRGKKETAGVLASAQQIIVYAAACAVDVTTAQSVDRRIADITTCVSHRLAEKPPKP